MCVVSIARLSGVVLPISAAGDVLMFGRNRVARPSTAKGRGPPVIWIWMLASCLPFSVRSGGLPNCSVIAAMSRCIVSRVNWMPVTTSAAALEAAKKSNSSGPAGHIARPPANAVGNSCMPNTVTWPPIDVPVR